MKVSAFTFLRNAHQLGFPFIESIRSALPLVDEFIVNVGESEDDTLAMVKALNDPKIKIIETTWNNHMRTAGFVYGQQKMIAQYSCTSEWALYLEADEILHENDYNNIRAAMLKHLNDDRVEALIFDYLHFYGNTNTYAWSPAWYRRAPRLIKTSVRNYAPDGLFWVVFDKDNKKGRYPNAALVNATMYHYGWVRPQEKMQKKLSQVQQYWNKKSDADIIKYREIDPKTLRLFTGTHPAVLGDFFEKETGLFQANPEHVLTKRERKNRWGAKLEKWLGVDLSKKHFKLV